MAVPVAEAACIFPLSQVGRLLRSRHEEGEGPLEILVPEKIRRGTLFENIWFLGILLLVVLFASPCDKG